MTMKMRKKKGGQKGAEERTKGCRQRTKGWMKGERGRMEKVRILEEERLDLSGTSSDYNCSLQFVGLVLVSPLFL